MSTSLWGLFSLQGPMREKETKRNIIIWCVSKSTYLKSFRCFRLHYTPPRKLDVRNFTAASLSQCCVSHSKEIWRPAMAVAWQRPILITTNPPAPLGPDPASACCGSGTSGQEHPFSIPNVAHGKVPSAWGDQRKFITYILCVPICTSIVN